jgi:hypothetical protein
VYQYHLLWNRNQDARQADVTPARRQSDQEVCKAHLGCLHCQLFTAVHEPQQGPKLDDVRDVVLIVG